MKGGGGGRISSFNGVFYPVGGGELLGGVVRGRTISSGGSTALHKACHVASPPKP